MLIVWEQRSDAFGPFYWAIRTSRQQANGHDDRPYDKSHVQVHSMGMAAVQGNLGRQGKNESIMDVNSASFDPFTFRT